MKCPNCGKDIARIIKVTKTVKSLKTHEDLIVKDVPIITCNNCGESLLSADVMKRLDKIRKHPEETEPEMMKVANF